MKCQVLFSRKYKKTISSMSSAESAHSMVSVKPKCIAPDKRLYPHNILVEKVPYLKKCEY